MTSPTTNGSAAASRSSDLQRDADTPDTGGTCVVYRSGFIGLVTAVCPRQMATDVGAPQSAPGARPGGGVLSSTGSESTILSTGCGSALPLTTSRAQESNRHTPRS